MAAIDEAGAESVVGDASSAAGTDTGKRAAIGEAGAVSDAWDPTGDVGAKPGKADAIDDDGPSGGKPVQTVQTMCKPKIDPKGDFP